MSVTPRPAAVERGVEALYVKLGRRVDGALLDGFPGLKAVATPTTGLLHVDLDACRARGVRVVSLRGETAFLRTVGATAELTWGLLLALQRRLVEAQASVKAGRWERDPFIGHELRGTTLGVIGMGRLGRMVAAYGKAFDMRVLYADPRPAGAPSGARRVSLSRLLALSDVISLHVHAAPDTERMIGPREFAVMKRRPVFLNTSRGELVDEKALLAALKSGRVRAAGLDVLSGEHRRGPWLRKNPLYAYARRKGNLLLTPHIGGLTAESASRAELFIAEKLAKILAH